MIAARVAECWKTRGNSSSHKSVCNMVRPWRCARSTHASGSGLRPVLNMESQEDSYWLERWEKGMTGWHKDSVDQVLQVDLVVDRERLSKAEC